MTLQVCIEDETGLRIPTPNPYCKILLAHPERRSSAAARAGLKTPRSCDKASAKAETAGSPAASCKGAAPTLKVSITDERQDASPFILYPLSFILTS